jgi:hypothetical protein
MFGFSNDADFPQITEYKILKLLEHGDVASPHLT